MPAFLFQNALTLLVAMLPPLLFEPWRTSRFVHYFPASFLIAAFTDDAASS
jgi:hypothetical protein